MNAAYNTMTSDGTYAVRTWFGRMVGEFERRAEGAGMSWDTATMYIVMSPNQWECIAKVYACAGIDLCSVSGSENEVTASANETATDPTPTVVTTTLGMYRPNSPLMIAPAKGNRMIKRSSSC